MKIVFDIETDPPRCLGEYVRTDVWLFGKLDPGDTPSIQYLDSYGETMYAPASECIVADVEVPRFMLSGESETIQQLHEQSLPIDGRPGWRRDLSGREWYSAGWLGEPHA